MSAFTHNEFKEYSDKYSKEGLTNCFLCDGLLLGTDVDTGGIVYWEGFDSSIALHQPCAESFAIHLIQDSAKLQIKTKKFSKLIPSEVRRKI